MGLHKSFPQIIANINKVDYDVVRNISSALGDTYTFKYLPMQGLSNYRLPISGYIQELFLSSRVCVSVLGFPIRLEKWNIYTDDVTRKKL